MLVFNNTSSDKYIIEVTDHAGKTINRIDGVSIAGQNKIYIDMHNYASGVYFITLITNETGKYSLKLSKQ